MPSHETTIRQAEPTGARELLQIVTITLPATSQYLDSILQLQTRIQLGLGANELFGLLQAHGFSPRWLSAPGPETGGFATLCVEVPEHAPQLLTCRTTRITVH
ncbi:hypothetical protein [Pseudomonas lopnurensis]|uniref:hypothetical protein n=1 Tax=Pseudomonas lopnurensis TaxID=1477517 RepID=UPI0028A73FC2|nr:hypothetical protein [Pseudomonas lopnurensis]